MNYSVEITGSGNDSSVVLGSESGKVSDSGNKDIVVNTIVSKEVLDKTLSLCQEITEKLNETEVSDKTLSLCQEITEKLNETEIEWNTDLTVPGLNTSMPGLRTTDQDILDSSNVLLELIEIDEMWVDSILDNNQGFLTGKQCICCNNQELYGTNYIRSIDNVLTKNPKPMRLNMDKIPVSMHGFSSLLTMKKDGVTKYALYDFGANARVLRENFASLNISEISLNTLIISHWHQDHTTDNLLDVIEFIYSINGNTPITLYFSGVDSIDLPGGISGEFIPKNTMNGKGLLYSNDNPTLQELQDIPYLTVVHTAGPRVILDGWLFLNNLMPVSASVIENGETFVPSQQRPTIYNWMTEHKRWWDRSILDASWGLIKNQLDDQCAEDTYIACNVKNYGYGLFSGCGHAGIVNIFIDLLSRDAHLNKHSPLYFVFGGLHLDNLDDWRLKEIVYILKELTKNHNSTKTLRPLLLSLSHCSSSYRVANMFDKFGENDRLMCAKITSTGSSQKYGVSSV